MIRKRTMKPERLAWCCALGLFLFFLPENASALQATTVGNNFACFQESDFEDLVKFTVAKDYGSMTAYVKQKKCFMLKEGLTVTVLKSPGMFGGKAQCAYQGLKFWTYREALKDYK